MTSDTALESLKFIFFNSKKIFAIRTHPKIVDLLYQLNIRDFFKSPVFFSPKFGENFPQEFLMGKNFPRIVVGEKFSPDFI